MGGSSKISGYYENIGSNSVCFINKGDIINLFGTKIIPLERKKKRKYLWYLWYYGYYDYFFFFLYFAIFNIFSRHHSYESIVTKRCRELDFVEYSSVFFNPVEVGNVFWVLEKLLGFFLVDFEMIFVVKFKFFSRKNNLRFWPLLSKFKQFFFLNWKKK